MNRNSCGYLAAACACAALSTAGAAAGPGLSPDGLWLDLGGVGARTAAEVWVAPREFRAVALDHEGLRNALALAPREAAVPAALSPTEILLPMPDGSYQRFRIAESPVMEPELAAKFPEIRTYVGQGMDDGAATVRLDLTPAGFHAQILSPNGAVYIDPHLRDRSVYASYRKRDLVGRAGDFVCSGPLRRAAPAAMPPAAGTLGSSGANLRTYRLAVAATAEYTAFHGGTVSNGLAAVVTAVNRVSGVYEVDAAIRMVLVANNHLIIYTNSATDPYSNDNPSFLLTQNQNNLDAVISNANYDVGHVFSTAGGGLATLGCVCITGDKAQGETGVTAPVGDAFYIDFVAHELGHQFGGNHTFNSSTGNCGGGNRNASTAYEVGSGSTIMAYAGICGSDDLQPHTDPYFHSISLDEILAYSTNGSGNGCAAKTSTGNSIPTVSAGANFTIPKSTPFMLTATGSDGNGDALSYCWEERDLGPSTTVAATDNGSSPLFRSFSPTNVPWRIFPQITNVLANTTSQVEDLPTTARTLTFRATVRDHRAGGGGVNSSEMQVTVATNAGPFTVSSFNGGGTFSGLVAVTWNVAGTTNAPVGCASVKISLSTNGGFDFPHVLQPATPNDGSESVVLPNIVSTNARIKVEGAGNIFFDICNAGFSIVPGDPTPVLVLESASLAAENCAPTNGGIDPAETVTVNFGLRNIGSATASNVVVTLLAANGVLLPSGPQDYGAVTSGLFVTRPFTFTANGPCGGAITCALQVVNGTNELGTVWQRFDLGLRARGTTIFSNPAVLSIPSVGLASSYPSTITVTNLAGGVITNVTVTLNGLSHSFPDDLDVLLVAPGGQKVMLMSDAGGGQNITNVVLAFDARAVDFLPGVLQITGGTYLPSDYEAGETMTNPAPAGPYGSELSALFGTNPQGTWSLFVMDDEAGDLGSISGGWSLSIAWTNLSCCTLPPVPSIASMTPGGPSSIIFAGTNGAAFGTNFLLGATNILQPLAEWLRIATNLFDANGAFVYTNVPDPDLSQRFFILTTP